MAIPFSSARPAPSDEVLRLSALTLTGFRNLAPQTLMPHPRFTRIVGENGQGKTNLLEAIHYTLTLRPLRTAKLRELVQHACSETSLHATLAFGDTQTNFRVQLLAESTPIHRVLRRELKTVQTDEYLTAGAVVGFTPDDLGLIRGGPERRRRFLDRAVFNRWPAYLGEARTYQRLLKSRNQLLRQRAPRDLREPFEAQLWLAGARLLSRRHALLAELRPLVSEAFDRIGLAGVAVQMKYKGLAAPASLQAGAAALAAAAEEKLALDQDRGFTSIGPHADDLGLGLGGRSARLYASQGQTRALVLALKVAEIENLRAQLGHAPILLLDDVSSELDPRRNQSFMTYLRERPAQVFLTTTDDTALALSLEGESVRWVMAQGIVKTE